MSEKKTEALKWVSPVLAGPPSKRKAQKSRQEWERKKEQLLELRASHSVSEIRQLMLKDGFDAR